MKTAEDWADKLSWTTVKAPVVEEIREEMRQEWVRENARWCVENAVAVDRELVNRLLAVGKPRFRKGQLLWASVAKVVVHYTGRTDTSNCRPLLRSDLCDGEGDAWKQGFDGPVFLKEEG